MDIDTYGPVVELRVHGVSGTPPEDVLDAPRVRQVAGDEWARVFRAVGDDGRDVGTPDHVVEALHWGRYTSGSWTFALWLLLVPFGMVNVARFMLPEPADRPGRGALVVASAALRALGVLLTCLLALGAAIVLVDLVALQAPGAVATVPARVLRALAVLAAGAVVGGFFLLARSSLDTNLPLDGGDAHAASALAHPRALAGDPDVPVLRRLHLAAGLATVALVGLIAAGSAWHASLGPVLLLLGLTVAGVTVLGDPRTAWADRATRAARGLAAVAVGLAVLASVVAAVALAGDVPAMVARAGLDRVCAVLVLAVVVALAVLLVANAVVAARRVRPDEGDGRFAPFARGCAATVVAALGVFLGVGYTGAAAFGTAELVGAVAADLVVPEMLSRAVYAWGLTTFVAAGIAVVAVVDRLRRGSDLRARAEASFAAAGFHALPAARARGIGSAMWVARVKQHVAAVAVTLALTGSVLSLAALEAALPQAVGRAPWDLGRWFVLTASAQHPRPGSGWVLALGTLVLAAAGIRLVLLGRAAARQSTTRRGVNVVWDVVAFWPRAVHPFVPPPYSQSVVPRLADRIRHHHAAGRTVVLCGHSQGSLISFATLVRQVGLGRPADRTGLLTFGSQIQVLFSRAFPASVNLPAVEGLMHALGGRWRNLYRETDPLAGPALSWRHRETPRHVPGATGGGPTDPGATAFGPDWRLLDPPVPDDELQELPLLPLRGHSDFWADPSWARAVAVVRPGRSGAHGVVPAVGVDDLAGGGGHPVGQQGADGPGDGRRVGEIPAQR
ncbi:hypothetical protein GCM10023200_58100 [Actinomycetospora chlora]|uniref:Integral membrane protein n=1 Tax=Actinomycetospora chlora TaxID=663608 RepID=A0ABP9CQH1_9PSEU